MKSQYPGARFVVNYGGEFIGLLNDPPPQVLADITKDSRVSRGIGDIVFHTVIIAVDDSEGTILAETYEQRIADGTITPTPSDAGASTPSKEAKVVKPKTKSSPKPAERQPAQKRPRRIVFKRPLLLESH